MPLENSWIILSLIAPSFWAVSNVIDQLLVRDSFEGKAWTYTFFQGVFYLPVLCVFPFLFSTVFQTSFEKATLLMAIGLLWIPGVAFYLMALRGDDASVAIPIFNTIPFLNLVGAWIFLGETITTRQIIAGSAVVLAAAAITWDFTAHRLRAKTFILMISACLVYTVYGLVARHQIATMHWAAVYFWYSLGFNLCCVFFLLFFKANRSFFLRFVHETSKRTISLCVVQAWLDVMAISCLTAAIAKAPALSLVSFTSSIQPVYVLITTGVAARFYPRLFEAFRIDKRFIWKIFCIGVMLIALYFLLV